MRTRKTMLKRGESMAAKRRSNELVIDADAVHRAIRQNAGSLSKNAISTKTGLKVERVARLIRYINEAGSGFQRIEYGAGVEHGVRRSRLKRLDAAHAIPGAGAVIADIEDRLGVSRATLNATDLAAFDDLVRELLPVDES